MADRHIQPNLGNLVMITSVSILGTVAVLGAVHYFSRKNVPLVSPAARGAVDVVTKVVAA